MSQGGQAAKAASQGREELKVTCDHCRQSCWIAAWQSFLSASTSADTRASPKCFSPNESSVSALLCMPLLCCHPVVPSAVSTTYIPFLSTDSAFPPEDRIICFTPIDASQVMFWEQLSHGVSVGGFPSESGPSGRTRSHCGHIPPCCHAFFTGCQHYSPGVWPLIVLFVKTRYINIYFYSFFITIAYFFHSKMEP